MYQIQFDKPIHVHFIGIGGISMSGLAQILLKEDFTVSGSDNKETPLTRQLEDKGARIFYGQKASNIIEGIDVVVYTAAIHEDNEEYQAAVQKGLPMLKPGGASGTADGATTRSLSPLPALTERPLPPPCFPRSCWQATLDPTISVGGILPSIGGNIRVGDSDLFVTEACEYTNSFLHFLPKISIILNIDADHLDFFKDLDDIRSLLPQVCPAAAIRRRADHQREHPGP